MKKLIIAVPLLLLTIFLCTPSWGESVTKSYKLSVTVPEHISVKAEENLKDELSKIIVKEYDISDFNFVILVRNDKPVYMRTIVVQ